MSSEVPRLTPRSVESSGDGGNGVDLRLRAVEQGITRLETKFDTELKHLATKEFIYKTILGGMGIAAAIAGVIIKFWPSSST